MSDEPFIHETAVVDDGALPPLEELFRDIGGSEAIEDVVTLLPALTSSASPPLLQRDGEAAREEAHRLANLALIAALRPHRWTGVGVVGLGACLHVETSAHGTFSRGLVCVFLYVWGAG